MIDLGQKANLGRSHRVVLWQKQLEAEDATLKEVNNHTNSLCMLLLTFVRRLCRSVNGDIEVTQVIFVRYGVDARNSADMRQQSLS